MKLDASGINGAKAFAARPSPTLHSMSILIEVLEESVRRHGAKTPVTLGHLLNIVKLAGRIRAKRKKAAAEYEEKLHREFLEEIQGTPCGKTD